MLDGGLRLPLLPRAALSDIRVPWPAQPPPPATSAPQLRPAHWPCPSLPLCYLVLTAFTSRCLSNSLHPEHCSLTAAQAPFSSVSRLARLLEPQGPPTSCPPYPSWCSPDLLFCCTPSSDGAPSHSPSCSGPHWAPRHRHGPAYSPALPASIRSLALSSACSIQRQD